MQDKQNDDPTIPVPLISDDAQQVNEENVIDEPSNGEVQNTPVRKKPKISWI